jgi:hypothetical protein
VVDRPDDVNALAEALRLWSDEPQRAAARPALLERATHFDLSRNVALTLQVLLHFRDTAESTSG